MQLSSDCKAWNLGLPEGGIFIKDIKITTTAILTTAIIESNSEGILATCPNSNCELYLLQRLLHTPPHATLHGS